MKFCNNLKIFRNEGVDICKEENKNVPSELMKNSKEYKATSLEVNEKNESDYRSKETSFKFADCNNDHYQNNNYDAENSKQEININNKAPPNNLNLIRKEENPFAKYKMEGFYICNQANNTELNELKINLKYNNVSNVDENKNVDSDYEKEIRNSNFSSTFSKKNEKMNQNQKNIKKISMSSFANVNVGYNNNVAISKLENDINNEDSRKLILNNKGEFFNSNREIISSNIKNQSGEIDNTIQDKKKDLTKCSKEGDYTYNEGNNIDSNGLSKYIKENNASFSEKKEETENTIHFNQRPLENSITASKSVTKAFKFNFENSNILNKINDGLIIEYLNKNEKFISSNKEFIQPKRDFELGDMVNTFQEKEKPSLIKCPKCLCYIEFLGGCNLIQCLTPFCSPKSLYFCKICRQVVSYSNKANHYPEGLSAPTCINSSKRNK